VDPEAVAARVPKADLHVHQERSPRLDRILAARERRAPLDWERWMRDMTAEAPPGMARLRRMQSHIPAPLAADDDPRNVVARIADLLYESARAGSLLVEPRFGNETVLRPGFFSLLRLAEQEVTSDFPGFVVAPVAALKLGCPAEEIDLVLAECVRAAREDGLAGVDLLCEPYDQEADWRSGRRAAAALADAGLGVTAHAGEFSTANLRSALELPGLTRIGHATHAAHDAQLIDAIAASGVTVECCLTSNIVLGAIRSLDEHPLPAFLAAGIPVALGTDDPVELSTTIDREYALAARLGLDADQLTDLTRAAIRASFAPAAHRAELLALVG
jgi:hypothetical protein